jgi:hypothetical protein
MRLDLVEGGINRQDEASVRRGRGGRKSAHRAFSQTWFHEIAAAPQIGLANEWRFSAATSSVRRIDEHDLADLLYSFFYNDNDSGDAGNFSEQPNGPCEARRSPHLQFIRRMCACDLKNAHATCKARNRLSY